MKKSYNIEREAKLVKIGRKKKRGIMITFPFNWDDVSKMHSLPNSKFHRKGIIKYWTCDLSVDAVEKLKNWDFNVDQKLCGFLKDQQIDRSTLEKVSIPELDQYLYPFQREGVAFLEARNGKALIADTMGLGKTIQSLSWLYLHLIPSRYRSLVSVFLFLSDL